ncbi:MAG: thiamine pyrophosphate-binding protein [Nitrospinota bacterium]|nr:thiamine pyrophosphate-binding protein [Nitrospinota bacterium]
MSEMIGARYIGEFLVKYGVSTFFFKPSILSKTLAQMDDLPIKRVLTHGEKAAAYMADGYARASGKPGVCGAQTVGAANLAAGLRDAYMENSPVISLTGGRFSHSKHKRPYQEIDDYPLFEPLTKANLQVDQVERIPDLMRQAFREATSGTPGPVNLQFLGNHGEIENDIANLDMIVEEEYKQTPSFRSRPDPELLEKLIVRLDNAKRPVIIVDSEARRSGAAKELCDLSSKLSIPIATSTGAYALVPENHPNYIGVPGTYSRSCTNQVLSKSDLVLFVGSEVGGQVTHFWKLPAAGTDVIQIGNDSNEFGRTYPNSLSILGDVKVTIQELIKKILKDKEPTSWLLETREIVEKWKKEQSSHRNSNASPIRPERIMKELSQSLPENVLFVCDTGHSALWATQQLWINSESWDMIRCAGSLGWAFPASIGAKCAFPERPVVCFTGDGGFWYHLQEIETAVRCKIPSVTIVNNNHSMNQEKNVYTPAYDGNPSDKWGDMWIFSKVNLSNIAEEMGAQGIRIEDPGQISSALEKGFNSVDRPTIIEVISDIDAMAPKTWMP